MPNFGEEADITSVLFEAYPAPSEWQRWGDFKPLV